MVAGEFKTEVICVPLGGKERDGASKKQEACQSKLLLQAFVVFCAVHLCDELCRQARITWSVLEAKTLINRTKLEHLGGEVTTESLSRSSTANRITHLSQQTERNEEKHGSFWLIFSTSQCQ